MFAPIRRLLLAALFPSLCAWRRVSRMRTGTRNLPGFLLRLRGVLRTLRETRGRQSGADNQREQTTFEFSSPHHAFTYPVQWNRRPERLAAIPSKVQS
jgi:hypothetical protein